MDNVELGNLTGLLARIKPAMDQVPAGDAPRNSKNAAFVAQVAEVNVRLVMQQIRERSPVLREMLDHGQIGLVGGICTTLSHRRSPFLRALNPVDF